MHEVLVKDRLRCLLAANAVRKLECENTHDLIFNSL